MPEFNKNHTNYYIQKTSTNVPLGGIAETTHESILLCANTTPPPHLVISLDQKSDRRIFVECVMALFGGFIHFWANSQKPKVLSLIQHFLGKSSEILFCFSPIVLVLNTCILQCMNDRLRNQWATFIFRRRPFKMCFLYIFCLRICGNFLNFVMILAPGLNCL